MGTLPIDVSMADAQQHCSGNEFMAIAANANARGGACDVGTYINFRGIRLAAVLDSGRGSFEDCWSLDNADNSVMLSQAFGRRFIMSREQFRTLERAHRFIRAPTNAEKQVGLIMYVGRRNTIGTTNCCRCFFCRMIRGGKCGPWSDGFNVRRVQVLSPGQALCIDECKSSWRGADGAYIVEGLPHVTKIQRKPEGVGCEIKAVADGETGILLQLEIQAGKQRMPYKRFARRPANAVHDAAYLQAVADNQVFKFLTAITLRLTAPWHGTGCDVVMDSAFGSVETTEQLSKRGTGAYAMVKTAHSQFPKAVLKAWSEGVNGQPPCEEVTQSAEVHLHG